jgi:putative ABC transport system substrate-binding protein
MGTRTGRAQLSRREFVAKLAGVGMTAAGLALAGGCGVIPLLQGQQNRRVRLGVLNVASRADTENEFHALVERAGALGWREGHNLVIEERWANGQRDAVVPLAAELARIPVDVIVAGGNAAVQAAKQATSTIPIVIAGMSADPVALRLVDSLARPGGNITGVSSLTPILTTKRLEILAEIVPNLSRLAVVVTPDNPSRAQNLSELQGGADAIGVKLQVEDVTIDDLPAGLEAARAWQAQALFFIGDAVLTTAAPRIAALVDQVRLPAMYNNRYMVESGGLMSYGADPSRFWSRAAEYVDQILRGANPAELPVALPTTFDFVVNLKAARTLGLTLPSNVVVQVTDWVE